MTLPGEGYDSWVSFKEESTYGTDPGGARDFYLRLVTESMKKAMNPQQYPGMNGPGVRGHFTGNIIVNGEVAVEFHYEGAGKLLKWAFGGYAYAVDTPEAGANQHTFSFDNDSTIDSFSMEISKGDIPSGDVHLYTGCIINSITLSWANQELVGLSINVIAQNETVDGAAVGSPTYADDHPVLWHFTGQLTVVGSGSQDMKDGSITIAHNMTEDRFLMGQTIAQPVRGSHRLVTGQATLEFADLTLYNKYVGGTKGSFALAFTSTELITGATYYSLTLAGTDSLLTAAEPVVNSPGPIDLPINFQLRSATAELSAVLVNTDTTYA
jgi:hypothetical protein